MKTVTSETIKKKSGGIIWKLLFFAGILMFLLYGLSFFLSKPTVETITTGAPQFDTNKQPMRDTKFSYSKRKH